LSYRKKIKFLIVRRLKISNKEADKLIYSGKISVNGNCVKENIPFTDWDEVKAEDQTLQEKTEILYFLFHKPRGIESTLSEKINDSLLKFIPRELRLFPVGRLDKDSEGLMLLTNNGEIYRSILEGGVEKEYRVTVDKSIDSDFKNKMEAGIVIMGKLTKPCKVRALSETTFSIILTEGRNRQIRRMCHKLGYTVMRLVRIRIGDLHLGDLKPGELRATELRL
jgi:23S rRNA pseudouridine2604 synthase